MMRTRLEDYTVGWVCAVEIERVVAREILDKEYARDEEPYIDTSRDHNSYTFGQIHNHNIVIASLPQGRYGLTSAAVVAAHMQSSFPALQTRMMVGIAGGAPGKHDIRLGDIVVSSPTSKYSGIIQYDFGKALQKHEFELTSHMAPPPDHLLTSIAHLKAKHKASGNQISQTLTRMLEGNPRLRANCNRPKSDKLYKSDYNHTDQTKCNCQSTNLNGDRHGAEEYQLTVPRRDRGQGENNPTIHYGLIASANCLMKDAYTRDALIKKYDILCFEMEAAGLVNSFPCVVVRGICDYSDSHKNDAWQGYAAAVAAIYAKELLEVIPVARTTNEVDQQTNSNKFSIPFTLARVPISKKFIDRPREMQNLQDTLLSDSSRRKMFILRGLGGIGKTQLAVEFMRLHHTKFSAVLWLDGSSVDSLKQSIAQHASRIPSGQISALSDDINTVVKEVMQWLSLPDNNKWLMIFDNVDREFPNPKSNPEPLSYDIRTYIPENDHGAVLITTRLVQLEKLGESHEVNRVDLTTAQGILTSWYKQKHDEVDGRDLLEKFDGLPLAIAQAGAYLQESGISIKTYLRLYEEQKREVAESLHKSDTSLNDYPDRSVWTTWSISYNVVLAKNAHAARLLVLWSWLDRNDLWYGMFERAREHIAPTLSAWLGNVADNELSFIEAMTMLRSYSLVENVIGSQGYSIHAVIHRWLYFVHGIRQRDLRLLALKIIGHAVPLLQEQEYARLQQRLLPHANMCFIKILTKQDILVSEKRHYDYLEPHADRKETENLLHAIGMLGILYENQGKIAEAEMMYLQALAGKEEMLGPRHISTLNTVNDLGRLYRKKGKLAETETMLMRALQGMEETIGANHVEVLDIIENLGIFYAQQGKIAQAETMFLRTLKGRKEVFELKHHDVLKSLNNLAFIYVEQGKLAEAETIFNRTLQVREETSGAKHTLTLRVVNNLGLVYKRQGKLVEAEKMCKRATQGYEEIFGPKHDETLVIMGDLGEIYIDQGKLDEAERILLQVLQGWKDLIDPKSIKTKISVLKVMHNLGKVYSKTKVDEARAMYSQALAGYKAVQGESSDICLTLSQRLEALNPKRELDVDSESDPGSETPRASKKRKL